LRRAKCLRRLRRPRLVYRRLRRRRLRVGREHRCLLE